MWCALMALGVALSGTAGAAPPEGAVDASAAWAWAEVPGGRRAVVPMAAAPFPCVRQGCEPRPYDDASVWVFVPAGHDEGGPVDLLVHYHGFESLLAQTVPAFRLEEQLVASGRDVVLVVPQGPVMARDGDFGQLMLPGGLKALVDEVVGALGVPLGTVSLSAHSGGYRAVARGLDHGGVSVHQVWLFDALYGERGSFRRHAEGGGRLWSVHTETGGTREQNLRLFDELVTAGLTVHTDAGAPSGAVVIGATHLGHSPALSAGSLEAWLRAAPLP